MCRPQSALQREVQSGLLSILLLCQEQENTADPVSCRGQPKQVDTHLRDRINTVLAHYKQQARRIIPLDGVVYMNSSLRTVQVCKHTGSASGFYLGRAGDLREVTEEQIGSLQGHLPAICSAGSL